MANLKSKNIFESFLNKNNILRYFLLKHKILDFLDNDYLLVIVF